MIKINNFMKKSYKNNCKKMIFKICIVKISIKDLLNYKQNNKNTNNWNQTSMNHNSNSNNNN